MAAESSGMSSPLSSFLTQHSQPWSTAPILTTASPTGWIPNNVVATTGAPTVTPMLAGLVPYPQHMDNDTLKQLAVVSLLFALLVGLILYKQNPPFLQTSQEESFMQGNPNLTIIIGITIGVFILMMLLPIFVDAL